MSTVKLLSGHEVVVMDQEFLNKWEEKEEGFRHGMVRIMPHGHLYSGMAPIFLNKIYNFNFRPDDLLLVTYPKSGTTWMQEILWTMIHNPDLDNPEADVSLLLRVPEIGFDIHADSKGFEELGIPSYREHLYKLNPKCRPEDGVMFQITEHTPGRRVIKSHIPLELMPPDLLDKCKVVYVARNPMDIAVSMFHFWKACTPISYNKSLACFINDFTTNNLIFGSYWPNLQQAWQKRNHPNLEFFFYEDMKSDIMAVLNKLDKFLGTGLTQKQLENVKGHTSFGAMKSRGEPLSDSVFHDQQQNECAGFFRQGKSGTWKDELPPQQVQQMKKWIQENIDKMGPDFEFKWEASE